MKRRYWWVIATESNGSMSYLKKECKYYIEAVEVMKNCKKQFPNYRYEIVQI